MNEIDLESVRGSLDVAAEAIVSNTLKLRNKVLGVYIYGSLKQYRDYVVGIVTRKIDLIVESGFRQQDGPREGVKYFDLAELLNQQSGWVSFQPAIKGDIQQHGS